jgi:hypothetical protein
VGLVRRSTFPSNEIDPMNKKLITKFAAIVQTPVFPKTLHQFRPAPKVAVSAKPPKRDNTFSKSRDVREDRGTREMKTSHNSQTFHAR